MDPLSPANGKR